MSSKAPQEELLRSLAELMGVEGYPPEKVLQQAKRLGGMRRAIEERVGLEDPLPLNGVVRRHEGA
ncbi:MAG: hypothetical protein QXO17_04285 [Nitrososphaerota archaeon]